MRKEGQNIHQSELGSTHTPSHIHKHAFTHTHTICTRMDSVIEEINVHN